MQVKYVDGDEEHLLLSNERVKFSVSEMSRLKLRCCLNCRNILMTQSTISIFRLLIADLTSLLILRRKLPCCSWTIIEISSSSISTWCYLTYLRRAIQNQRRRFVQEFALSKSDFSHSSKVAASLLLGRMILWMILALGSV
nr:uncharacterized protein LOC104107830 isoform X2 [Nicotiana tomentosiformis]XP_033514976.1 uncharacterized protein LOC104107830 isoform X2 [Nicotiana tomentosiformis]